MDSVLDIVAHVVGVIGLVSISALLLYSYAYTISNQEKNQTNHASNTQIVNINLFLK